MRGRVGVCGSGGGEGAGAGGGHAEVMCVRGHRWCNGSNGAAEERRGSGTETASLTPVWSVLQDSNELRETQLSVFRGGG